MTFVWGSQLKSGEVKSGEEAKSDKQIEELWVVLEIPVHVCATRMSVISPRLFALLRSTRGK